MEKMYIQNDAKENALKAYFYMEKLWTDFSSIGLDIGKNKSYSALQGMIVDQVLEYASNGEDDFLDRLSEDVSKCGSCEEFLSRYLCKCC